MSAVNTAVVADSERLASPELLLQLHLAEYQAITGRATNLIVVAYSLFSVLLIFVALVAQIWPLLDRGLLLWGGALAVLGIGFTASQIQLELLYHVIYMEHILRPKVAAVAATSDFWGFEASISKRRPKHPVWWEWSYAPASLLGIAIISWARIPFHLSDYVWLVLNLIFCWALLRTNYKVFKLRLVIQGNERTTYKPTTVPTKEK